MDALLCIIEFLWDLDCVIDNYGGVRAADALSFDSEYVAAEYLLGNVDILDINGTIFDETLLDNGLIIPETWEGDSLIQFACCFGTIDLTFAVKLLIFCDGSEAEGINTIVVCTNFHTIEAFGHLVELGRASGGGVDHSEGLIIVGDLESFLLGVAHTDDVSNCMFVEPYIAKSGKFSHVIAYEYSTVGV